MTQFGPKHLATPLWRSSCLVSRCTSIHGLSREVSGSKTGGIVCSAFRTWLGLGLGLELGLGLGFALTLTGLQRVPHRGDEGGSVQVGLGQRHAQQQLAKLAHLAGEQGGLVEEVEELVVHA